MVSFGASSLCMNIHVVDVLNIIKHYVNNGDQLTRKTTISQAKFFDLVNLVLATTQYTFKSQLH